MPRESWRSLQDVQPQLAEFELRCDAGDYQRAMDLQTQALAIARETGDRGAEARHMSNLGNCYGAVGEHGQAADLMALALGIAREVGERQDEGMHLGNLGLCHASVGEYEQAVDLYTQSLAIAREVGDRYGEANAMTFMSRVLLASDDARQAVTLLEQAVRIADSTGDLEPAVAARSLLARARLYLGAPEAALAVLAERREAPYPLEEPALCLLDGLALLELRRLTESRQALTDAVAAADALLALADRNVAALEARALALSGLAVVAGDPARAAEAVQAFAQARAVTRAPGVVAETRRLLGIITAHDQSGVLAAFDSD